MQVRNLPCALGNRRPSKAPKPVKVLLITGGCCHNYAHQAKKLVEGSAKIARVEWKVLQDPRKGTKGKIDLYKDPNWAKDYDVVAHNECFASTTDDNL